MKFETKNVLFFLSSFSKRAFSALCNLKERMHREHPVRFVFATCLIMLIPFYLVTYKYLENKTQSKDGLTYLSKDGEEMLQFTKLMRPSGMLYSSGDIEIGQDKKMRLKKGVVDSKNIKNKSIKNEDIGNGAIDARTIEDGSIDGLDINPDSNLNVNSIFFGANSITKEGFVGDWNFQSGGLVVGGNIDSSGGMDLAGDLKINGELKILEGGSTPTHFTTFQGGNQSSNITYTLPTVSVDGILKNEDGELSWDTTKYQPISEMGNIHAHAGVDYAIDVAANTVNPNKGTLNVKANSASFYTDNTKKELVHVDLAAVPVLVLTEGVQNFIVADRETKTFVALLDEDQIDYVRYLPYAEVFKRAGSSAIHMQLSPILGHGEIEASHDRIARTNRYAVESGLDGISVNSNLEITLSGGYIWSVNTRYHLLTSTTATRGFVNKHDGAGNWISISALNPKIDNINYDNGTGLVELDDGYYNINYIYRGVENEDHIYVVYSNQEYASLDLAKAAGNIGDIPDIIKTHAVLIGRVISQKNNNTDFVIESAFGSEKFSGTSAVTSHGSLTGLSADSHPQYALLAGRVGGQTFSGNVGFGMANPQYALDVKGADDGVIARFQGASSVTGCAIASDGTISCSSDENLKKNIKELNFGLSTIMKLKPVSYNWKTESDSKEKSLGFIAQDVESVIPKLVSTDSDGLKQLNTIGLVPVTIKALQEQQVEIETLKDSVEKLTKKIQELEAK